MHNRRVITGLDATGKSIIVSDSAAPRVGEFKSLPGFVASLMWETPANVTVPWKMGDPTMKSASMLPLPGGTNLLMVQFPPDSAMMSPHFDPAAFGPETVELLPGLAQCFEVEAPGMHTTDTVDYDILLDGEMHLELDEGATVKINPGDVVVQTGTRHAWRNKSDRPATLCFVLVGARRER